jgi:hypothetical protein
MDRGLPWAHDQTKRFLEPETFWRYLFKNLKTFWTFWIVKFEIFGHCLELNLVPLPDEAHGMQILRPKSSRSVIYNDPAITNTNMLLLSRSINIMLWTNLFSSRNRDMIFIRFGISNGSALTSQALQSWLHCTVFLANLNKVSYSTKFDFRWLLAEENWPQRLRPASETRIQSRPCTPFLQDRFMYTKLCTVVPPWNVSKLQGELFNVSLFDLWWGTMSSGTNCVTLGP